MTLILFYFVERMWLDSLAGWMGICFLPNPILWLGMKKKHEIMALKKKLPWSIVFEWCLFCEFQTNLSLNFFEHMSLAFSWNLFSKYFTFASPSPYTSKDCILYLGFSFCEMRLLQVFDERGLLIYFKIV